MTLSKEHVLQSIIDEKPISIIRYGDGESIILNCLHSVSALKLANHSVLHRQLGYWPSVNDIEAIRSNLVEAYSNCNTIGVPMQKNLTSLNSHWTKAAGILKENVPGHTSDICSIDIAYEWLTDGSYDKLLRNRHILNYISCRDLDTGFHTRFNIGRVNKYTIAPEAKFTSGYDGDVHYPSQFNKVQRWMDVVGAEGNLLLVGAGVIGKIYCNWWRDRGGRAMDVGGVMDCWAGKVTRGPERGLDKEDLSFKL